MPAGYFGINFPKIWSLSPASLDSQLAKMKSLGIDAVRFDLSWRVLEPVAPVNHQDVYHFDQLDTIMAALARNGIEGEPTLDNTPTWASGNNSIQEGLCRQFGGSSNRPAIWATEYFASAFNAVAKRYGRGGTFWTNNQSLPYDPITTYEVWNEPNLEGGWCPTPDPELYADFFKAADQAISQTDPKADVIIGGMAPPTPAQRAPNYLSIHDFVRRMLQQEPSDAQRAAAFAAHAYPGPLETDLTTSIAALRAEFTQGGLPTSMPMTVNEIGWPTKGTSAITEAQRAAQYARLATDLPRSNCNISSVLGHSWSSNEANPRFYDDWYGIANPITGQPYPSALSYSNSIALERGQLPAEAPHALLKICGNLPSPDRDGDGVPDEHDYYPLDPTRWEGPPGWDDSGTPPPLHGHKHARKTCRHWYHLSASWLPDSGVGHRTIIDACVRKYLELRKAGQLKPLRTSSLASCRASTPPLPRRHGHRAVQRHHFAVKRCTYRLIRQGLNTGY